MKNVLKYVIILFFFTIVSSCKKDNTVEPNDNIGIKGVDYFPIQENSAIRYKYISSASSIVYTFHDEGEAVWKINSSEEIGATRIYSAVETLIYTSTTNGSNPKLDTLITSFTISENSSKIISFKSSILDGVSFNRYLDPRQEQGGVIILAYNNPGSLISAITISLKNNVGLSKIFQFGNRWSKTYELIE